MSLDGLSFNELPKWKNPLAGTPATDHNCDPDIHINTQGAIEIYYLETLRPKKNNIRLLTEQPIRFSNRIAFQYDLQKNEPLVLSPAYIEYRDEPYLFLVNNVTKTVEYINFTRKKHLVHRPVHIQFPSSFHPWHLDISSCNGTFYLLTNGYYGEQSEERYTLYLSESKDLEHWSGTRKIMSTEDIPDSAAKYIYRSTFLTDGTTIGIWYSYVNTADQWHMGFKKCRL